MPSGPSHSSHSHSHSGGFHSGGHSSSFHSSGSRSSGSFRPRRPIHMHLFGHTYIIGSGGVSKITALIFVTIFLAILCTFFGFAKNSSKKDAVVAANNVAIMEADAREYKELIDNANTEGEGGYYLATQVIYTAIERSYYYEGNPSTGYYYYDDYLGTEYFFIVYEYYNEAEEKWFTGETYAQYTSSQARGQQSVLKIAYAYSATDGWYSINMDYTLNRNVEYKLWQEEINNCNSSARVMNIIFIVIIVFIVLLVLGVITTIIKEAKKSKKDEEVKAAKDEAEINKVKAETEAVQAETANKTRYCVYCGSKVPASKDRCPSCGSTRFTATKKKFE